MTRSVFCRKHKEELPGLQSPPFPGAAGEDIFNNVSQQAWDEWTEHQTRLINEKHLNTMNKDARAYLVDQRTKFLSGEAYDSAEGYVPENKDK